MSLMTPEGGLLFWMTIIFIIVFAILAKFGFPIITGMVEKRRDRINESIRLAREAEEKFSLLSVEQKKLIDQAEKEREKILKEATALKEELLEKSKEDARVEARKIMDEASKRIQEEKDAAMQDLRKEIASFSIAVAEKIVSKELAPENKEKAFIEKTLDEISSMNTFKS